ncbi:MAG: mechanosensitive ion channel family protein [Tenuifilaceae bacterium]|nr:mechanosensitive ion channel family protein [Tenuifilaceae bacterium]
MNRMATSISRSTIILMLCLLWITPTSAYTWQQPLALNTGSNDSIAVVATTEGVAQAPQNNTPPEKAKSTPTIREEITHPPDVKGMVSFGKIFWSIVFIFIGYFILKAISGILTLISDRKPKYQPTIRRILPMVKIAGWAFVTYLIISGIFQPPRETVFAFFASVGVAIGFASQDLLKNIFGGLMILFDKPFQIGDKIESGKYYGEVLEVGLRSTRIVTPDDSVVTIPNSEMMNQSISNANSSENNCQVVAEVYLPHTIDTKRAREIALEVAQVSKYIYLNKPITVLFFSEKTNNQPILKMRLKAYVNDVRHEFPFKSEMTELVLRELQKDGLIDAL